MITVRVNQNNKVVSGQLNSELKFTLKLRKAERSCRFRFITTSNCMPHRAASLSCASLPLLLPVVISVSVSQSSHPLFFPCLLLSDWHTLLFILSSPVLCTNSFPFHSLIYYHASNCSALSLCCCCRNTLRSFTTSCLHLQFPWLHLFCRAFYSPTSSLSVIASPQPFIRSLLHLFFPRCLIRPCALFVGSLRHSGGLDFIESQPALWRFVCGAEIRFRVRTNLE